MSGYRMKHWVEFFCLAFQMNNNSWRNSKIKFAKFYGNSKPPSRLWFYLSLYLFSLYELLTRLRIPFQIPCPSCEFYTVYTLNFQELNTLKPVPTYTQKVISHRRTFVQTHLSLHVDTCIAEKGPCHLSQFVVAGWALECLSALK